MTMIEVRVRAFLGFRASEERQMRKFRFLGLLFISLSMFGLPAVAADPSIVVTLKGTGVPVATMLGSAGAPHNELAAMRVGADSYGYCLT